jgi:hypothetical protein
MLDGKPNFPIVGFSVAGEYVYYATTNKQLFKMRHNSEKIDEIGKFSFLIGPNHTKDITGIQTCLKRQILLTSSRDGSIKQWSFNNANPQHLQLEIC